LYPKRSLAIVLNSTKSLLSLSINIIKIERAGGEKVNRENFSFLNENLTSKCAHSLTCEPLKN
jgi:hypothetical protein